MSDLHDRLVAIAARVMRLRDYRVILHQRLEASETEEQALRDEYASVMKEYMFEANRTIVGAARKAVKDGSL